jgi:hypothetical protein
VLTDICQSMFGYTFHSGLLANQFLAPALKEETEA